MTIVHIGLGKTATTALQKSVFPELLKRGMLTSYNDKNLTRLLILNRICGLSLDQRRELNALVEASRGGLVSLESLVDWNPQEWISARDENFRVFGKNATILLTIRDPKSYLTSVYQQMVAQGHVITPKDFFVTSSQYASVEKSIRRGALEVFNQEAFDLEQLVGLYQEKFSRVIVVALPNISSMRFLDSLVSIDESFRNHLGQALRVKENRSYSNLAMRLTLRREKILNAFGIRSKSSHDFNLSKLARLSMNIQPKTTTTKAKTLISRLQSRLLSEFGRLLNWRYLMQAVVNRCLPYRKFELPAGILNEDVLAKNEAFYRTVLTAPDGYLTLKRLNGRNRKS